MYKSIIRALWGSQSSCSTGGAGGRDREHEIIVTAKKIAETLSFKMFDF